MQKGAPVPCWKCSRSFEDATPPVGPILTLPSTVLWPANQQAPTHTICRRNQQQLGSHSWQRLRAELPRPVHPQPHARYSAPSPGRSQISTPMRCRQCHVSRSRRVSQLQVTMCVPYLCRIQCQRSQAKLRGSGGKTGWPPTPTTRGSRPSSSSRTRTATAGWTPQK